MKDQKLLEEAYNQILKKEPFFFILSGIHGDEPAGDLAVEHFRGLKNVEIWSSINPTSSRRLGRKDLNRHFEEEGEGEIQKRIENRILKLSPSVVINLHEDDETSGVYAYTSSELLNLVSSSLLKGNLKVAKKVHGDKAENRVIISGKQPYKGTLERFLKRRGILYFTLETPSSFYPLKERVLTIKKIISHFLKNFSFHK